MHVVGVNKISMEQDINVGNLTRVGNTCVANTRVFATHVLPTHVLATSLGRVDALLRAAYYIWIFLYIAAESRATAPLCWQHMCWSKDRHRAHFERRAQRRQSGRAVRWSTASTTNCIFPSSLLHKP